MFRISLLCCLAWLMAAQPARAEWFVSDECDSARLQPQFPDGGLAGYRRWVLGQLTFPASECDREVSGPEDVPLRVSLESAVKELPQITPAVMQDETVRSPIIVEPAFGPEDGPLMFVEKMPSFQGGDLSDFRRWVYSKMRYPTTFDMEQSQGYVAVSFIVGQDGSVSNLMVILSSHHLFSEEALRVIAESPRWTPGMHNGKLVRVRQAIPIFFLIPSPSATQPGQRERACCVACPLSASCRCSGRRSRCVSPLSDFEQQRLQRAR